jgi:hypothetical protein
MISDAHRVYLPSKWTCRRIIESLVSAYFKFPLLKEFRLLKLKLLPREYIIQAWLWSVEWTHVGVPLTAVCGGAVGWGTVRVRFPMESLGFFIELILPTAIWPWGPLSL